MTPKTHQPTPLSELLPGVMRTLGAVHRPPVEEMASVWKRLAGEEAAQHSWPKRLVDGRLMIEVENSGWMYVLGMKKMELLEGWMELLGAARVRGLSFRMGEKKDG